MRKFSQVLMLGAAAMVLANPALAAARHTWYRINYAEGKCEASESPAVAFAFLNSPYSHQGGVEMDRIAPSNVTKDADGATWVHMTGTRNGEAMQMNFFTTTLACSKYLNDNAVVPEQASPNDIN